MDENILVYISRTRFFHYMIDTSYIKVPQTNWESRNLWKIYFFYLPLLALPQNGQPPHNPLPLPLPPSPQTTKGHWWTDWVLKSRLINIFKEISSTGNALEYSKTFAFICKFFINNDKVSKKFRQSCSKYVETGWFCSAKIRPLPPATMLSRLKIFCVHEQRQGVCPYSQHCRWRKR